MVKIAGQNVRRPVTQHEAANRLLTPHNINTYLLHLSSKGNQVNTLPILITKIKNKGRIYILEWTGFVLVEYKYCIINVKAEF